MKTYGFQNLDVWMESKSLVLLVYDLTKNFPKEELFGLTNQMRRSAISITSNIAEGSGRYTKKNQSQFYTIAYGSLMELLNQLIISTELNYINSEFLNEKILPLINNISYKLYKLKQV